MTNSTPPEEEDIGSELIENREQLEGLDFGAETVACQVCSKRLQEDKPVVAYAVRLDSESSFTIGQTFCQAHAGAAESTWSRSGRELIVQGYVGTAKQSSRPVLVGPEVWLMSPSGAVEAYTPKEWEEIQPPSASEIRRARAGDDERNVNAAVLEVNELAEPSDVARPVAEQSSASRDGTDHEGEAATDGTSGDDGYDER